MKLQLALGLATAIGSFVRITKAEQRIRTAREVVGTGDNNQIRRGTPYVVDEDLGHGGMNGNLNNKNGADRKESNDPLQKELRALFDEDIGHWDRFLAMDSMYSVPSPTLPAPTPKPVKQPTPAPYVVPTTPPQVAPTHSPTIGPSTYVSGPTSVVRPPVLPPTMIPATATPVEEGYTVPPSLAPVLSPVTYPPTPTVGPNATVPTLIPATTWQIIIDRPEEFSTFIAASQAVGFDEILQADGDMTVFAPNDAAFTNLMPADLLEKYFNFDLWTDEYIARLMSCHDIQGSIIFSFQFQNGTKILPCVDIIDPAFIVTTPPSMISKSTMPVPANIVEADLLAKNGVVHIIDQVMTSSFLRMNLPESAEAFGAFNILLELVVLTGLLDFVSGPGPFTLYAPPDSVFESYGQEFIDGLRADPEGTKEILLNHVVPDLIVPCCLPAGFQVTTAAGFQLTIDGVDAENPSDYTVNGVPTVPTLTGILTSNSKVNTISDILFLPSSTTPVAAPSTSVPVPSGTTTWDIIKSRPEEFATFIAASEAVGFDVLLEGNINRTVFVPNEEAFGSILPVDLLTKYLNTDLWSKEYIEILLFCHEVTSSVILSSSLKNGTQLSPCIDLIDPFLLVTLPPPQLSKATMPVPADIVELDLVATNGVVHVIDQVITNSFLRFDLVEATEATGSFNILLELLEITGLLELAMGDGPFTVFAPPDEVFESYGQDFIDGLKGDPEGTKIVLLNHIVPDVIIPCCLGQSAEVTSAAGFTLVLDGYSVTTPSEFTVNGVSTIPELTDLLTSNAKVNTITDILFPPAGSVIPSDIPSLAPSGMSDGLSESPVIMSESPSVAPVEVSESPSVAPVPMSDTVWDYLNSRKSDFATYIAASEAVGYDDVLKESSSITVFVPLESAFGSLQPADLLVKYVDTESWTTEYIVALLRCHDVSDEVILSTDLVNGTEFATCADLIHPEYKFTSPPPQISIDTMPEPADLVEVDIVSGNGVIHVIDQVLTNSLFRYDALQAGEIFGQFNILLGLIDLTGLTDFFIGPGPFTIFAPPDEVFAAYGQEVIAALQADVEGTRKILLNHVIADVIVPCCATTSATYESVAGFLLVLDDIDEENPSSYTVNGVKTVPNLSNILVSNAKVNTITDILFLPIAEESSIPSDKPSTMPSTEERK
jgi:transforming growth factor-beta-induced protein